MSAVAAEYDIRAIAERVLDDPRRARLSQLELEAMCSWVSLVCAERETTRPLTAPLAGAIAAVLRDHAAHRDAPRSSVRRVTAHLALEASIITLRTTFEEEFSHE